MMESRKEQPDGVGQANAVMVVAKKEREREGGEMD